MRTLIYKRTHKGDPDKAGCFGIRDCMGNVRNMKFDAVIGVGGVGEEARTAGISGKVNWIGVGSRKEPLTGARGPLVRFDHFVLFEDKGPDFQTLAPKLAKHMYSKNVRVLVNFSNVEQREISRILEIALDASPSAGKLLSRVPLHCPKCVSKRA
jgi:hypothetical protein